MGDPYGSGTLYLFEGLQSGEYGYIGGLQMNDGYPNYFCKSEWWDPYFGDGSGPAAVGRMVYHKPYNIPEKFSARVEFLSTFLYNQGDVKPIFCWILYTYYTSLLYLFYDVNDYKFKLYWTDGYHPIVWVETASFAEGSGVFTLNQQNIIDISVDLRGDPPPQTGVKIWVNKILQSSSWSGIPSPHTLLDLNLGDPFWIGKDSMGDFGEFIILNMTFYDDIAQQYNIDTDYYGYSELFQFPERIQMKWKDVAIGNWSTVQDYIHINSEFHPYGFVWEFKKGNGIDFNSIDYIKLDNPIINSVEKSLMTADLYNNVKADLNRLRMVQQVFQFECKLDIEIYSNPPGWQNIISDIWVWVNDQYSYVAYRADTGLKADEGRKADATVASILGEFYIIGFGNNATYPGSSVHDVSGTVFEASGVVTVDEIAKTYDLLVFCKDQSFTYFNEIVVKNESGDVIMYLIMPKVEKTSDKIYIHIKMHYGGD